MASTAAALDAIAIWHIWELLQNMWHVDMNCYMNGLKIVVVAIL